MVAANAVLNLHQQKKTSQNQLLIVYNVKGKQLIEIINGSKSIIMGNDTTCINKECKQMIQAAHTEYTITKTEKKPLPYYLKGRKISVSLISTEDNIPAEKTSIVIPSLQVIDQAETICRIIRPELIVLDASHSAYAIKIWSSVAEKHQINIHAVSRNGAFVKTLN